MNTAFGCPATTTSSSPFDGLPARAGREHGTDFEVELSIGGQTLIHDHLDLPSTSPSNAVIMAALTPWLPAAQHTVRVRFENGHYQRKIAIHDVRLSASAGADANGDGTTNWVADRIHALNNLSAAPPSDVLADGTIAAKVSPHSIEGRARHLLSFSNSQGLTPVALPHQRWALELPLDPEAPVAIDCVFENGALTKSAAVTWVPFNLLTEGDIHLRPGDQLRLAAATPEALANVAEPGFAAGQGTITVTDPTGSVSLMENIPLSGPGSALIHTFDLPGTYQLQGAYEQGGHTVSATVEVRVLDTTLGTLPSLMVGAPRSWTLPPLPSGLTLEFDQRIKMLNRTGDSETGMTYSLQAERAGPALLAVRVEQTGALLHTVSLPVLRLSKGATAGAHIVETFPNGEQIVEFPFVLPGITDDMRIEIEIFTGQTTTLDGGKLLALTAADFDQHGIARARFLMPPGSTNCHRTRIYQGDQLIDYIH